MHLSHLPSSKSWIDLEASNSFNESENDEDDNSVPGIFHTFSFDVRGTECSEDNEFEHEEVDIYIDSDNEIGKVSSFSSECDDEITGCVILKQEMNVMKQVRGSTTSMTKPKPYIRKVSDYEQSVINLTPNVVDSQESSFTNFTDARISDLNCGSVQQTPAICTPCVYLSDGDEKEHDSTYLQEHSDTSKHCDLLIPHIFPRSSGYAEKTYDVGSERRKIKPRKRNSATFSASTNPSEMKNHVDTFGGRECQLIPSISHNGWCLNTGSIGPCSCLVRKRQRSCPQLVNSDYPAFVKGDYPSVPLWTESQNKEFCLDSPNLLPFGIMTQGAAELSTSKNVIGRGAKSDQSQNLIPRRMESTGGLTRNVLHEKNAYELESSTSINTDSLFSQYECEAPKTPLSSSRVVMFDENGVERDDESDVTHHYPARSVEEDKLVVSPLCDRVLFEK